MASKSIKSLLVAVFSLCIFFSSFLSFAQDHPVKETTKKEKIFDANEVIWYQPAGLDWDLGPIVAASTVPSMVLNSIDDIIAKIVGEAKQGDQVLIMSNGGFGGIHRALVQALEA